MFPLSATTGAAVWRYKAGGGVFWGVVAGVMGIISSLALLIACGYSVYAVSKGNMPSSPESKNAYYRYYVHRIETLCKHEYDVESETEDYSSDESFREDITLGEHISIQVW